MDDDDDPPPPLAADERERVDALAQESAWAVVIAVVVSGFGALIAFSTVCAEQHACLKAGTCYVTSNATMSCGFRTAITPAGWRMLNASDQWSSLQAMNRGVCAPGLRQSVDPSTGDLECVRKRSYPSALNEELGDPAAAAGEDHRRWCGKWIDARPLALGTQRWAFFDEQHVADDVDDVLLAKGSGRLGVSDVAKFRAACRSMVASNSAGPAAERAYLYLEAGLDAIGAASLSGALKAVGYLASHFCDAPANPALTFDGDGYLVRLVEGVALDGAALREALYGAGADSSTRDKAAAFAEALAAADASGGVTQEHAQLVVLGSHQDTWLDGYLGPTFRIAYDPSNPALARFVVAAVADPPRARAYLRGLAAHCAQASRSVVAGEFGGLRAVGASVRTVQAQRARSHGLRASALGRVRGDDPRLDRWDHFEGDALLNASLTTWGMLAPAVEMTSATRAHARSACLRTARVAFPDAFDGLDFRTLVTDRLFDRLETLVARVKTSAEQTLQDPLIGDLYATPVGKAHALATLRATRVRVAGAPPGSWAGVSADAEARRPELTSDDGALLILIKQARAVYLNRLKLAVAGGHMCDHPPLFDALRRNAYLLLSTKFSCAMLLPGILVAPFADERYDEASLYARIGYVLAHEFMHVTAFRSQWDEAYAGTLLHHYDPGTYIEAIADGGGVAAVLRLGIAGLDRDALCAHVSQLWCGRVGWLDGGGESSDSHPPVNKRGDYACAFLRERF